MTTPPPTIRSHGILYNNGPNRMDVFLDDPDVLPGDTVLFIVGGGNQVTSATSDVTWLSDVDGQEAQGSIFKTEAEGYVNPTFWFDGGDPQRVLYVVFQGEVGLQVMMSARDGVAGSTFTTSTFNIDMTNPVTSLGIYYCFLRNGTDNPTLTGPTVSTLDTYTATGTHTARAWTATGVDQETILTVPDRSGHYRALVRAFPYKYTYATGTAAPVYRYSSITSPSVNDSEFASGHVRQTTGSYYEPTAGDVTTAYANLDASKLEGTSSTAGIRYYTDYDADLFGPGRDSYWYAEHGRSPTGIAIDSVSGIQTGGTVYWNPNYIDPADRPAGYIRWEWDDGDRWNSKLIPVTGAEHRFSITKWGHDNTTGTDVDKSTDFALNYTVQSDGGVTFGSGGSITAWSTYNASVVTALSDGEHIIDVFPYLNASHRALVTPDVPSPYLMPDYPPSMRNTPGNWELAYGWQDYFPGSWGTGTGSVRWTFTPLPFRWVMAMEEDDGSVVVTGEVGRLRVLVNKDGATLSQRWKFMSPKTGENLD